MSEFSTLSGIWMNAAAAAATAAASIASIVFSLLVLRTLLSCSTATFDWMPHLRCSSPNFYLFSIIDYSVGWWLSLVIHQATKKVELMDGCCATR